jgi:hypothetical protein
MADSGGHLNMNILRFQEPNPKHTDDDTECNVGEPSINSFRPVVFHLERAGGTDGVLGIIAAAVRHVAVSVFQPSFGALEFFQT